MPAGHDLELVERARAGAQDRQQRLDQRDVDHLAVAAVTRTVVEREQHGDRPGQAGHAVGQPERRQRRRAVGLAGLVREAGHRLGERPECPPGGVRPELAEAGHAQDHQRRVDLVQAVRAEAPLLQHARAEVLDQDVSVGRQLLEQFAAGRVRQVQGHRSFVAPDHLPPQAMPVLAVTVGAGRVPARVLDLEDISAVVPQEHRGDRRGVHRADVEYADAVQRPGRGPGAFVVAGR